VQVGGHRQRSGSALAADGGLGFGGEGICRGGAIQMSCDRGYRLFPFVCEITKIPPNLCVEFGELYGYYRHFGVGMDLASRVAVSPTAQTHESSGSA
jgi:hypothetical protein